MEPQEIHAKRKQYFNDEVQLINLRKEIRSVINERVFDYKDQLKKTSVRIAQVQKMKRDWKM